MIRYQHRYTRMHMITMLTKGACNILRYQYHIDMRNSRGGPHFVVGIEIVTYDRTCSSITKERTTTASLSRYRTYNSRCTRTRGCARHSHAALTWFHEQQGWIVWRRQETWMHTWSTYADQCRAIFALLRIAESSGKRDGGVVPCDCFFFLHMRHPRRSLHMHVMRCCVASHLLCAPASCVT